LPGPGLYSASYGEVVRWKAILVWLAILVRWVVPGRCERDVSMVQQACQRAAAGVRNKAVHELVVTGRAAFHGPIEIVALTVRFANWSRGSQAQPLE